MRANLAAAGQSINPPHEVPRANSAGNSKLGPAAKLCVCRQHAAAASNSGRPLQCRRAPSSDGRFGKKRPVGSFGARCVQSSVVEDRYNAQVKITASAARAEVFFATDAQLILFGLAQVIKPGIRHFYGLRMGEALVAARCRDLPPQLRALQSSTVLLSLASFVAAGRRARWARPAAAGNAGSDRGTRPGSKANNRGGQPIRAHHVASFRQDHFNL